MESIDPAGNVLDSLPSLRNNDPERFAGDAYANIAASHGTSIPAGTQTIVAENPRENVLLSREVNRMSYWNLQSVITVVSLVSSLLMPPFISAADKLSALYSAQSVSYSLPWIAQDAGLFRKHNLDFQLGLYSVLGCRHCGFIRRRR